MLPSNIKRADRQGTVTLPLVPYLELLNSYDQMEIRNKDLLAENNTLRTALRNWEVPMNDNPYTPSVWKHKRQNASFIAMNANAADGDKVTLQTDRKD